MKLTQSFDLPFSPATVWAALQDLDSVARCLPGAALDGPPEDGVLRGHVAVRLGAMSASFAGEGTVVMNDADMNGVIEGGGTDRRSSSRVKGRARFAVVPAGEGETTVGVEVDYQLAGALAQFNRGGIVLELAGRLTAAFAENLKTMIAARIEATAATIPATAAAVDLPTKAPTPVPVPPLRLGSLLWAAFKAWLSRRFGRSSAF